MAANPNPNPSWGPWAATNPMAAFGDPAAMWAAVTRAAGAPGVAWPVDPVDLASAGLETWRWLVNAQIDFALATLSSVRR
jgi:hypothetical protein